MVLSEICQILHDKNSTITGDKIQKPTPVIRTASPKQLQMVATIVSYCVNLLPSSHSSSSDTTNHLPRTFNTKWFLSQDAARTATTPKLYRRDFSTKPVKHPGTHNGHNTRGHHFGRSQKASLKHLQHTQNQKQFATVSPRRATRLPLQISAVRTTNTAYSTTRRLKLS